MILFYKNGNTLKIHNPSAETKYYQMPSVNSVLATEDDLTKVTTVSSAIKQPVILTPANNSTGFNGDITFTGFETIETFTGTLDAISIAIATDINFANVVVLQRVVTTDAGSFNIAVDLSSSDLYIKVKYHSDLYSSVWSNPIKTTTPEYIINKPTIIGPTNGATGVALFPMISGSDFTYVGVDETHESTTYQIAKDVTFTDIAYNVTSNTDLTSHLITEDLDYETTYYIRMRYNGSKYGNSEWSNTITISTVTGKDTIIEMGNGTKLYIFHDIIAIDYKNINAYAYGWSRDSVNGTAYSTIVKLSMDNTVIHELRDINHYDAAFYVCDNSSSDGNLVFMGHSTSIINGVSTQCGKILKVTKDLVPLKDIVFTKNNVIFRATRRDIIGNYYVSGIMNDNTNRGVIIKLDSSLNFINGKIINLNGNISHTHTLEIDTTGNIILMGISYTPNQEGTFILKFNSNLALLDSTSFNYFGNTTMIGSGITASCKDDIGNIYAVGTSRQWNNINNLVINLYKIDPTNLTISLAKQVLNNDAYNSYKMKYYNGSIYMVTNKNKLLKWNIATNVVTEISFTRSLPYTSGDIFGIDIDSSGNIYMVGYHSTTSNAFYGQIYLLNSGTGILDETVTLPNGVTYTINTAIVTTQDFTMQKAALTVPMVAFDGTTIQGNSSYGVISSVNSPTNIKDFN